LLVIAAACTSATGDDTADSPGGEPPSSPAAPSTTSETVVPTTAAPTTTEVSTTTTTAVTTTTTLPPTTTTAAPTTTATTAPPSTTAPTTTAPARPRRERRRRCVVQVRPGDSLSAIADSIRRKAVTVESLQAENGISNPDSINAGDRLDVCVGNDVNDITGEKRVTPPAPPVDEGVQAQQQKLNELFAGFGLPALAVDGDSGRLTEQQLCAARIALGLPINRADMAPGSPEEQALMAATSVPIPANAPVSANRWALIDRTCQVIFLGEGSNRVVHVFTASTGEPGHETRDQNGSRVFRYDPARENGGWHNSSVYPVSVDNPLNGNMYRPLYFDNGQAIHGANTVPPSPASKGCVRLRVESQDALVNWLGLGDVSSPIWDSGQIDLSVTVQGQY
jgi:hypothetical protein